MIHCPKCLGSNIIKNGNTHYGKQNHRCKDCARQFVLHNNHSISALSRRLIKKALKERLSLRAICRVFGVSLTWLQAFAHALWEEVPRRLGLKKATIKRIKKLQVFGLQADELWSFVQKKSRKRWIWVVFDPVHRLVVACHIGGRGVAAAKQLWRKLPKKLRSCWFETDDWDAYKKIIPAHRHRIGKEYTYYIEGFNATIRARSSRLVRKGLSFSKSDYWHNKAISWFFWQYNLEQHPYI